MNKSRGSLHTAPLRSSPMPLFSASLKDFQGTWLLSRTIEQHNGETFVFEGTANFTWHHSDLIYQEAGKVKGPHGNVLAAERRYIWQQSSEKQIDVLFEDKRYFHSFSATVPVAEHLCGDDHYTVNYHFETWPAWQAIWQVTGPRKDYRMHSHYVRG